MKGEKLQERFEDFIVRSKHPTASSYAVEFARAELLKAAELAEAYWLKPHNEFGEKIGVEIRKLTE